jgi:hypothetical protein
MPHTGRPILRETKCRKMILILCPFGHVLGGMPAKDWAGSWLEAKATDPNWQMECHGTLPTDKHEPKG